MRPTAKWLLWITSALTGLTGAVYWWMDTMMEPVDEWAVINHPLQPWVLKAHLLVAPVLVFSVGVIATEHIWKHFRNAVRQGRRSGLGAMLVVGPMILSGYLLQTLTQPTWLEAMAWLHLGTGTVYLAALVTHRVAVLGTRRKPRSGGNREHARGRPDPARSMASTRD